MILNDPMYRLFCPDLTDPGQADESDERRLRDGRHLPAFRDLVVFAGTAISEEATRA